eukprot:TRINITY_DN7962_c0_g6_i1.p1 TRINITY_DN7962_c0_g6~~TRINITY_DN7962_c0_g6_i1.p1  ORF type:complete len:764 (+),score=21.23 TRINITY_DN7962_c0_g6_i1:72-2363(+)
MLSRLLWTNLILRIARCIRFTESEDQCIPRFDNDFDDPYSNLSRRQSSARPVRRTSSKYSSHDDDNNDLDDFDDYPRNTRSNNPRNERSNDDYSNERNGVSRRPMSSSAMRSNSADSMRVRLGSETESRKSNSFDDNFGGNLGRRSSWSSDASANSAPANSAQRLARQGPDAPNSVDDGFGSNVDLRESMSEPQSSQSTKSSRDELASSPSATSGLASYFWSSPWFGGTDTEAESTATNAPRGGSASLSNEDQSTNTHVQTANRVSHTVSAKSDKSSQAATPPFGSQSAGHLGLASGASGTLGAASSRSGTETNSFTFKEIGNTTNSLSHAAGAKVPRPNTSSHASRTMPAGDVSMQAKPSNPSSCLSKHSANDFVVKIKEALDKTVPKNWWGYGAAKRYNGPILKNFGVESYCPNNIQGKLESFANYVGYIQKNLGYFMAEATHADIANADHYLRAIRGDPLCRPLLKSILQLPLHGQCYRFLERKNVCPVPREVDPSYCNIGTGKKILNAITFNDQPLCMAIPALKPHVHALHSSWWNMLTDPPEADSSWLSALVGTADVSLKHTLQSTFQNALGHYEIPHVKQALLFYGTSSKAEAERIMRDGFKLPKPNIQAGPGESIWQQGSGIYFQDALTRALEYTRPSQGDGYRYVVIANVVLGPSPFRLLPGDWNWWRTNTYCVTGHHFQTYLIQHGYTSLIVEYADAAMSPKGTPNETTFSNIKDQIIGNFTNAVQGTLFREFVVFDEAAAIPIGYLEVNAEYQ